MNESSKLIKKFKESPSFSDAEKSFILPYIQEMIRLKDEIVEEFHKFYHSKTKQSQQKSIL